MARKNTPMPGANRDDDTGEYRETYPSEDFVDAIEAEGGEATTQAVADRVGCAYETAYKKLRALADAGEVDSLQVGNAYLWTVVDNG